LTHLKTVEKILEEFRPVSLGEMDSVKLMDRTDTKFVLNASSFPELLRELKKSYHCLDVKGVRDSRYETVYLDTPNLDFYLRHHNGKRNRYKVRFRKYVESELTFLEIKFKNNKSRTVKNRVIVPEIESSLSEDSKHFIHNISGVGYELRNTLHNTFRRITLVNDELRERLTLDLDLQFSAFGKQAEMGKVIICELKQERVKRTSPFFQAIRSHDHRPMRISKYCMGIAMLNDRIKKNNFKENLLLIDKFNDDNRAA